MSRTVKYLFTVLVMSAMLSGCLEGPVGPQGEKGDTGEQGDSFVADDADKVSITIDRIDGYDGIFNNIYIQETGKRENDILILDILYLVDDGKGNTVTYKKINVDMVARCGVVSSRMYHCFSPDINLDGFTVSDGSVGVSVRKKTSNTVKIKASVQGYNVSTTTLIELELPID